MKRFIKKTIAVTSALAMTLSIAPAAFAAGSPTSGSITSDSQLEGFLDKNVYDITVPTVAGDGIDFTVDPQGLLKVADSSKWATGAGAVYFKNAPATETEAPTYSKTSDAITVVNNSSFDIKVSCEAKVNTADTGVNLVAETALQSATDPSLYIGLIEDTATAVPITTAAPVTTSPKPLAAVPEVTADSAKGYIVKASAAPSDSEDKSPNGYVYSYELTSAYKTAPDGKSVSYKLEGACDSSADWSGIATDVMSVDIVWTVTADELELAEPATTSIATAAYSRASATNTFAITWGQDVPAVSRTISKVEVSINSDMSSPVALTADAYSLSGNNVVIDGTKAPIGAGAVGSKRYVRVTFDNGVAAPAIAIDVTA